MNIYITGLYGDIKNGLGRHLSESNWIDEYLELSSGFMKYGFQKQLEIIEQLLNNEKITATLNIIAVSFGAYLLLNTLIKKEILGASVLLFSPVLGITFIGNGGRTPKGLKNLKRLYLTNQCLFQINAKS